jgi:hypothetical protein
LTGESYLFIYVAARGKIRIIKDFKYSLFGIALGGDFAERFRH